MKQRHAAHINPAKSWLVYRGGIEMTTKGFMDEYQDIDVWDLLESGFQNMVRVSFEGLQEQELEENSEVLPEEQDDCWR